VEGGTVLNDGHLRWPQPTAAAAAAAFVSLWLVGIGRWTSQRIIVRSGKRVRMKRSQRYYVNATGKF